jgi:multidrug efflux pump subunit AcrA (membrane-fusion protein)
MKIAKEFHQDKDKEQPGYVTNKAGMNVFVWNLRYPNVTSVEGTNVMWAGDGEGVRVLPGNYKVRLVEDKESIAEQDFVVKKDPRVTASDADLKEQFDLHQKINKKVDQAHIAINQIRKIKTQINGYLGNVKDSTMVRDMKKITKPIVADLEDIESKLMQPKAKAPQDVLAFPVQLNDKMAGLGSIVSSGETKPTKSSYLVYEDLASKIDKQIARVKEIMDTKIPEFNNYIKQQQIPAITIDPK